MLQATQRLFESVREHEITVYAVFDSDDTESVESVRKLFPQVRRIVVTPPATPIYKWNEGLREAAKDSNMTHVVLGADDVSWHDGWLDEVSKVSSGLVGLNTLEYGERHCTHFVLTRQFIVEVNGGVIFTPHYKHLFADNEILARARQVGAFQYCPNAIVEHLHPAHGKARLDDTYTRATAFWNEDQATYERRVATNFPCDYEAVCTLSSSIPITTEIVQQA
jgi:hypothetical protein